MSEEYKIQCQTFFQNADTDGTGSLNRMELCKLMQKCGSKASVQELSDWFGEVDVNHDDSLTFEEFWSQVSKRDPHDVKECELRTVFKDMDSDGSGKVSVEELKVKMSQVYPGMEIKVEEIISEADRNQDGQIDFDEFLAEWRGRL